MRKSIKNLEIVEAVEAYYKQYGAIEGKKLSMKLGYVEGRFKERHNTIIKFNNHGFEIKQIADILEIKEEEVLKALKDKSLL